MHLYLNFNILILNFDLEFMPESIQKKPLKKGSLVVLDREKYINSVESLASDIELPN